MSRQKLHCKQLVAAEFNGRHGIEDKDAEELELGSKHASKKEDTASASATSDSCARARA
jgi:hypothetical protein